jgi:hypothetical protein
MQNTDTLHSRKKKWHFSVEKDFICDRTLSPVARMLYLVLMSYASPSSPVPFPGMRTLSTILQCSEDTIRKYRQELELAKWLVVERRRDGHQKWLSNAYILLDGPDDAGAIPKKPDMAFSGDGENPTPLKPGIKRGTSTERSEPQKQPKAKTNSSSNTGPSGADAAAAADSTPAATQAGETPAPPPPSADSKAETFIQEFRHWSEEAKMSSSVVPRERQAAVEFFSNNQKFTPRELIAIMLSAWIMQQSVTPGTNHEVFWHCRVKSKRIKTFLDFLPNIQDELEWSGSEKRIERSYRLAQKQFSLGTVA